MRTATIVLVLAAACSGGDHGEPVDATRPIDAAVAIDAADVDAVTSCAGGGPATVDVDLGTDAAPVRYPHAWWNHGHSIKACFDVAVVLSTAAAVDDAYTIDPAVIEVWFARPPLLGDNAVQVYLHAPDRYLPGVATMAAPSADQLTGTVHAADGGLVIDGGFTAVRCEAIYDPCI